MSFAEGRERIIESVYRREERGKAEQPPRGRGGRREEQSEKRDKTGTHPAPKLPADREERGEQSDEADAGRGQGTAEKEDRAAEETEGAAG